MTHEKMCRHCGKKIRPFSMGPHRWRHVETGRPLCTSVSKADPVTLRSADAHGYLSDLLQEADHCIQRAHALLSETERIMKKMAEGETESL